MIAALRGRPWRRLLAVLGCACLLYAAGSVWPRGPLRDVVLGGLFLAVLWTFWSTMDLFAARHRRRARQASSRRAAGFDVLPPRAHP
jgi:hypothetical protein